MKGFHQLLMVSGLGSFPNTPLTKIKFDPAPPRLWPAGHPLARARLLSTTGMGHLALITYYWNIRYPVLI
jgi:hypothetical protein